MASTATVEAASAVEQQVGVAHRLMQQGRFSEALAVGEGLLPRVPENRDVLYLIAVCQRYLGRLPAGLATLARLEQHHPGFGRLFQERGHCHRALREPAQALEAYRRAVELNGALLASWTALAELLRVSGQLAEAASARAMVEKISSLPEAVVTATALFAEGELAPAEQMVRRFLLQKVDDVEGMRLLARICLAQDVLDDAEYLLESVLLLTPDYAAARYDYATVLWKRQRHAEALAEAELLLRGDPHNRGVRTLQAGALVGLGNHAEALTIYRDLLQGAAQPADLHLSIGHALKTLGHQQEAIEAYHAAAAARPGFGDAYWSLANLKTYRFDDGALARMRREEAAPGAAAVDRYHLCFALGKALEDRGLYDESFACYDRGNRLKKAETRYDPAAMERTLRAQATVCTAKFFGERAELGCHEPGPVFIVGLPRAGSTLIEQILASHSCIEGTMELGNIPRLVQQLGGRTRKGAGTGTGYPFVLADLMAEQAREYGEKFLRDTHAYRHGKPIFIDKMPNNFRHLGLIHLILPNARVIDARREPLDCCFSNFKQLFATGQEFTYSLEDIGRYYRNYVELMDHWDRVLPGKMLRVQHEDVVADLEGSVRRMLDFLGLDFEPACLEFHRTERAVRTASSEQVRRPINRDGVGQWRHYDRWLGPLRAALEPGG